MFVSGEEKEDVKPAATDEAKKDTGPTPWHNQLHSKYKWH